MGKTYQLDLETLLYILVNGEYQLTAVLSVSNSPATAFVTLTNGKITSYVIQLRDGRRIDGEQVLKLLLKQPEWDVQSIERKLQPQWDDQVVERQYQPSQNASAPSYKQPTTPIPASNYKQPTTPIPASSYRQSTTSPLPPTYLQQSIPHTPYRPTFTRPLTSGVGQGPALTVITPQKTDPNTPAQSTPTTHTQQQLPQSSPIWQTPTKHTWSYADTGPSIPVGDIFNPHHHWLQKNNLQDNQLANIPSQKRLILHYVLMMINGRRTTVEIQSALNLRPDSIVDAIETLVRLNVIE